MCSVGVREEKGEKTKRANQTFQETGRNAASSEGKGGWNQKEAYKGRDFPLL